MYIGNQKKNGTIELEIVKEIPKTERLDIDIHSPISYDDFFEIIPQSRLIKQRSELRVDIPNELRIHMLDLLKNCGIDDFNDENNILDEKKNQRIIDRDIRNKKIFKSYCIGPPFITRLLRYNLLEKKFPNFFEFGINLTPTASFLVNEFRLIDMIHPKDNPWYKGCKKIILTGIPSFLNAEDIKNIILSLVSKLKYDIKNNANEIHDEDNKKLLNISTKQTFIHELGIDRLTNMFTTENKDHYLNNLYRPTGVLVKNDINMALLEFSEEQDALDFWALLSTGSFQCYGSVLTAIPDPSGLRIFVEGMLAVFSPKNIPLMESIDSSAQLISEKKFSCNEDKQFIIRFPLLGSSKSQELLKRSIESIIKDSINTMNILIEENNDNLVIKTNNKKTIELLNNRLFQHCTFKIPNEIHSDNSFSCEDLNIINTAMFLFYDKVCEPVIIHGDYDFNPVKHRTIDSKNVSTKDKNLKNNSNINLPDQDTEPAGFLFKKFEELREALQHDLAPNLNFNQNLSNDNSISNKNNLYVEKNPLNNESFENLNSSKNYSNQRNDINKDLSPNDNNNNKDYRSRSNVESPYDFSKRSNYRKRSINYLNREDRERYEASKNIRTSYRNESKAERSIYRRSNYIDLPKKSVRNNTLRKN